MARVRRDETPDPTALMNTKDLLGSPSTHTHEPDSATLPKNGSTLGEPSAQYTERITAFDATVRDCISVSREFSGIRSPTAAHFWASTLFTVLCTRAVSIATLAPYSPWSKHLINQWDYASLASLARSFLEIRLAFFYLGIEPCTEAEWYCRWNVFNIHDCTSRIHMFRELQSDSDIPGFEKQLHELRARLTENQFFLTLAEKQRKQLLNGKVAYLNPLEDIAVRAGVELRTFRWIYKFFSTHVHGLPMSYYRMGNGDRGRGTHSKIEESYTSLCISMSLTLLIKSRDEMRAKFAGIRRDGA